MEPEFLDPGPDQPRPDQPGGGYPPRPVGFPPPAAPPAPGWAFPAPAPPTGRPARRESVGLVLMLVAAAILPVVAARQTLFTVVEQNLVARESFSVSAWGDYAVTGGQPLAGHAPRFGILLVLGGAAFGLLAVMASTLLLGARTDRTDGARTDGARIALGIAAAATGLVGLLVGVTAAMTLQIQSSFAGYQAAAGVLEVRLRVGSAVWLSLVGVLAGGLAVTAALRVRRAFREAASGY